MNKLSNKSIEKFKIFLNNKEFGYISLTRHELKILYSIYNSVISIINESEEKENKLIKYLEGFIDKTDYEVNIKGNYLYLAWANAYRDLLEKVKGGKYDS